MEAGDVPDKAEHKDQLTEGNSIQYTFMAAHDVLGLWDDTLTDNCCFIRDNAGQSGMKCNTSGGLRGLQGSDEGEDVGPFVIK